MGKLIADATQCRCYASSFRLGFLADESLSNMRALTTLFLFAKKSDARKQAASTLQIMQNSKRSDAAMNDPFPNSTQKPVISWPSSQPAAMHGGTEKNSKGKTCGLYLDV
jgi:hypothetical protein